MRIRRGPAKGMKWIASSSVHGCWLGTYELKKRERLEHFLRPGMTVYNIDVRPSDCAIYDFGGTPY
jgi:hypothetical protein